MWARFLIDRMDNGRQAMEGLLTNLARGNPLAITSSGKCMDLEIALVRAARRLHVRATAARGMHGGRAERTAKDE